MKIHSLPMELFIEILDYLADYEHLQGLDQILDPEYTLLDVRSALRELVLHLRKEMEQEKESKSLPDYGKDKSLSPKARHILSALSPSDERKLLNRFGLIDES